MVLVNIKWGKQVFEDVELDLDGDVETFKALLYSLTGFSLFSFFPSLSFLIHFNPLRCTYRYLMQAFLSKDKSLWARVSGGGR